MKPKTPTPNQSDWRRILAGVIVSLLALFLLFQFFDWDEVVDVLLRAEWVYLLLVPPVCILSYILRAIAWRTMLKEAVPLRQVFLTMNTGYLLNNILPFRLGELGRAVLLGRDGLGFWRVFSTILIERAFDLILAAGLLLGTLPFVWDSAHSGQVALLVGSVVILGLLALYLLARNKEWAIAQFERFVERWPLLSRIGKDRLEAFLEGLETLTSLGRFLRVLGWMLSSWALAIVVQYLILRSFFPDAKILYAAFGLGFSSLGVAVPSSPGYIGVYEAVLVAAYALFDIPTSTAFAHALTAHLLYIVITGIFGTYGLINSGESLGQIFERVRNISILG
ncbi:MAG: lysylphosphatidylglycerol synthase transmembrane domain-containing protein [Chloroflexota bacterium]|nr:lysylphosphatidylglycerol synthase transmembrane domain-containing protein [Chloroflexota bacterium]